LKEIRKKNLLNIWRKTLESAGSR